MCVCVCVHAHMYSVPLLSHNLAPTSTLLRHCSAGKSPGPAGRTHGGIHQQEGDNRGSGQGSEVNPTNNSKNNPIANTLYEYSVHTAHRQIGEFSASRDLPGNLEEALVLWINRVCEHCGGTTGMVSVSNLLLSLRDGKCFALLLSHYLPQAGNELKGVWCVCVCTCVRVCV